MKFDSQVAPMSIHQHLGREILHRDMIWIIGLKLGSKIQPLFVHLVISFHTEKRRSVFPIDEYPRIIMDTP